MYKKLDKDIHYPSSSNATCDQMIQSLKRYAEKGYEVPEQVRKYLEIDTTSLHKDDQFFPRVWPVSDPSSMIQSAIRVDRNGNKRNDLRKGEEATQRGKNMNSKKWAHKRQADENEEGEIENSGVLCSDPNLENPVPIDKSGQRQPKKSKN